MSWLSVPHLLHSAPLAWGTVALATLAGGLCATLAGLLYTHRKTGTPAGTSAPSDTSSGNGEKLPLAAGPLSTFCRQKGWLSTGPLNRTVMTLVQASRSLWGHKGKEHLPWVLVAGDTLPRQDLLMKTLGLCGEPGLPSDTTHSRLHGFLFPQGLVWSWHARDTPAEDKEWGVFCELLKTWRPRRPLDGVVLVLPAELLGPDAEAPRKAWMLQAWATLWTLQQKLGMNTPVWIVVSRAEKIPGLAGLAQALGDNQQDIWGWVPPWAPGTLWDATQAETFCQFMRHGFQRMVGQRGAPGHSEQARILFGTTRFWRLSAPVWKELLDDLFKPSTLHEPFRLRGVALTGLNPEQGAPEASENPNQRLSAGLRPAEDPEPAPPGARPGPGKLFPVWGVHRFFLDRVFPEAVLAWPVSRMAEYKTRALRWMGGAMAASGAVLGLGTLLAVSALNRSVNELMPVLHHVHQTATHMHNAHHRHPSPEDRAYVEARGRQMLTMLHDIHPGGLTSVFLPVTWFSSLRKEAETFLVQGYDTLVMGARGLELVRALHAMKRAPATPETRPEALQGNPLESQPFLNLQAYVMALADLEQEVNRYTLYQRGEACDHVQEVLTLISGKSSFWRSTPHLTLKRRKPHTLHLEKDAPVFQGHVQSLYRTFLRSCFTSAPLQATAGLFEILVRIQDVLNHPDHPGAWKNMGEPVRNLTQELSALSSSPMPWIEGQRFAPGPDYDALMNLVSQTGVLGEPLARSLGVLAQRHFFTLQQALKQSAPLVGSVLEVRDNELTSLPSPDLVQLSTHLAGILQHEIFQNNGYESTLFAPATDAGRIWDEAVLEEISQRLDSFDEMLRKTLPEVHPLVRKNLERLCRARIRAVVRSMLASAWAPLPQGIDLQGEEETLKFQIQNLQKALPVLTRITGFMKKPVASPEAGLVRQHLRASGVALALRVDRLFHKERLYTIDAQGFQTWNGEGHPGLAAFQVPDLEELKYVLSVHRERVSHWITLFMDPLMQILQMPDLKPGKEQEAFMASWAGVIAQGRAAGKKTPGNALSALEHFVLVTMAEVTPANAESRIKPVLTGGAGWFERRLDSMAQGLLVRCTTIRNTQARTAYEQLAAFFNSTLAGRTPFAAPQTQGAERPDAAWTDIRQFAHMVSAIQPLLKNATEPLPEAARTFLAAAEKACAFFSPFAEHLPEDADPASFDLGVNVTLKYGSKFSQGLSSVAGWSWQSGETPVTLWSPEPRTGWHMGQPVSFSMEWSEAARCIPDDRIRTRGLVFESPLKVTWSAQGSWALLQMLTRHQAQSRHTGGRMTPGPGVLVFSVPTRPRPSEDNLDDQGSKQKPASLAAPESCPAVTGFIRIGLSVPAKDKPLLLKIPVFPEFAPPLESTTGTPQGLRAVPGSMS